MHYFEPENFVKIIRFIAVGLIATALYLLFMLILHRLMPFAYLWLVSFFAYLGASIFSYLGHKFFTFVSAGNYQQEVPRFTISMMIGFGLAIVLPIIVHNLMGFSTVLSALSVAIAVPIINFVVLNMYVFRPEVSHGAKLD